MSLQLWGCIAFIGLTSFSPLFAQDIPAMRSAVGESPYQPKDYSRLKAMEGFGEEPVALHLKLYEGYVKNANLLRQKLRDFASNGQDRSPEYAGLKRMYGWEYDGMRLHEYYFDNLGGRGGTPDSQSPLGQAIAKDFGSYEDWKKDFISTGLMRGIGWVVLYQDPTNGKLTNAWINEHDLGHLAGNTPLLIMDVFEHAYMPKFGLDRAKYIEVFFQNVDWDVVAERLPHGSSKDVRQARLGS